MEDLRYVSCISKVQYSLDLFGHSGDGSFRLDVVLVFILGSDQLHVAVHLQLLFSGPLDHGLHLVLVGLRLKYMDS